VIPIPGVVDLYTARSMVLAGKDPLTPYLLPWLHNLLNAVQIDAKAGRLIRYEIWGTERRLSG
jgi:hypothetical protein